MRESWVGSKRDMYTWCRKEESAALKMLRRENGTYTGDLEEIDGLLRRAYRPLSKIRWEKNKMGKK